MKFYLEYLRHLTRLNRRTSDTSGFTLVEILLAGMMMLFVIMIAGMGLVNILRNNYKTNADSKIQNNINSTIEFISDEIRRAKTIVKDESKIVREPAADGRVRVPADGRAVLAFNIPNPTNSSLALDEQVVYYTKAPTAGEPWIGPRVLWRYGPNFNEKGEYVTANDTSTWVHSPLVDMLVETAGVPDKDCNPYDADSNLALNELNNWNRIPVDDSNVKGFFVCVKKTADGEEPKLVMLRANSQIPLTSFTGGIQDKAQYSVDTRVYTRSGGKQFTISDDPPCPSSGSLTTQQNGPYRLILSENATISTESASCESGLCRINIKSTSCPGSGDSDLTVGDIGSVLRGKDGYEISLYAGVVASINGDRSFQSVDLYTYEQTLPTGINVTLKENQVLYVLTDLISHKTYPIVVTINPE